ncbi:Hsp70 protein-domain-containing protein [Tribonema minus]|uniref:Hsp70 protein-domain-containing protein n=1 Tax=Tribonema minus TaxID=303371 RepID=A0A835ZCE0_9STRA|nr:Hsp70 protein-domain-containing protein [Tribonema minus]
MADSSKPPAHGVEESKGTNEAEEQEQEQQRKADTSKGLVVGIDLGTTYSVVSVLVNGRAEVVDNDGSRTTPSVVCYLPDGTVLVGGHAKECGEPGCVKVYDTKRIIGLRFSHQKVAEHKENWTFEVEKACAAVANAEAAYEYRRRSVSPVEVAAHILISMLRAVQFSYNEPVAHMAVSIPAYFDSPEKHATHMAVQMAAQMYGQGINMLGLISEPFAASIAYAKDTLQITKLNNVIVFDLGGGTFDTCLLNIHVKPTNFGPSVIAYGGNNSLGGRDIDNQLVRYCIDTDMPKRKKDFNSIPEDEREEKMHELRAELEKAKRALSTTRETYTVRINKFFNKEPYIININRQFLRNIADACNFYTKCMTEVDKLLNHSEDPAENITAADVSKVLLVGGGSRLCGIREMLTEKFGDKICCDVNPDEVVSRGACYYAAVVTGRLQGMRVVDVVTRSLGLQLVDVRLVKYVVKGARIPSDATKPVRTLHAGQRRLILPIIEGEDADPSSPYNTLIGTFKMPDLPNLPAGEVCVDVTFEVDSNGIVTVSAQHPTTKEDISVPVTFGGSIDEDKIKMVSSYFLHPTSIFHLIKRVVCSPTIIKQCRTSTLGPGLAGVKFSILNSSICLQTTHYRVSGILAAPQDCDHTAEQHELLGCSHPERIDRLLHVWPTILDGTTKGASAPALSTV